jgi:hypothetical protein
MPPVGFEPTISAGERPQTYALVRAAIGTGNMKFNKNKFHSSGEINWSDKLAVSDKIPFTRSFKVVGANNSNSKRSKRFAHGVTVTERSVYK